MSGSSSLNPFPEPSLLLAIHGVINFPNRQPVRHGRHQPKGPVPNSDGATTPLIPVLGRQTGGAPIAPPPIFLAYAAGSLFCQ